METPNEQNAPTPLMNHALKHGVILAAISIVCVMILYVVDLSMMATFKFFIFVILLALGYVIYAGIDYRKELGGYISYGKALQHGFLLLAVSGLISTLFNILLYYVIDPDLPTKLGEAILANTEEIMLSFGAPQASIDEALAKARVDMKDNFTIAGLAYGYLKILGFYAVIVLITSLIVRKSEPVEI